MFEQICDICAKTFKTKQGFQEHLAAHTDTEATRVQCNYCRAWLKNRSSLNKHIKTHTDQPQKCEICNKMKPNRAALNHHKRTVHSAPIHQCNICDKTFKRSLALTVCTNFLYIDKIFEFFEALSTFSCYLLFTFSGTYSFTHWRKSVYMSILPENVQI